MIQSRAERTFLIKRSSALLSVRIFWLVNLRPESCSFLRLIQAHLDLLNLTLSIEKLQIS